MQSTRSCVLDPDDSVDDFLVHLSCDAMQDDESFQAYIQQLFLDPPEELPDDQLLADPPDEAMADIVSPPHDPSSRPKTSRGCRRWTEVDRLRHRDFCKGKRRLSRLEKAEIINIWNSTRQDDKGMTQVQIARVFGKSKSAISRLLRPQQRSDPGDSGDGGSKTPVHKTPSTCWARAPRRMRLGYHVREIAFSICATAFGSRMCECKLQLLLDQSGAPVNGLNLLLNRIKADLGLLQGSYHLCYRDEDEDEIVVTSDNELGVVMSEHASDKPVALYLQGK